MKTIINYLLIITILVLSGCVSVAVDEDRAGCFKLDGKGRAGSLTQYVKGDGSGVSVYIGKKLKGKVQITCNINEQEIIYQ
jgi:hypothetical protein